MMRLFRSPIFWGGFTVLLIGTRLSDPAPLTQSDLQTALLFIVIPWGIWFWRHRRNVHRSPRMARDQVPPQWRPDPNEDPIIREMQGDFRCSAIPLKDSLGLSDYVVVAIKTTGFVASEDRITEISADKYVGGAKVGSFHTLVNPRVAMSEDTKEITGIDNAMVSRAPVFAAVINKFCEFIVGFPLVVHGEDYVCGFLNAEFVRCGYAMKVDTVDTLKLSRKAFPALDGYLIRDLIKPLRLARRAEPRRSDEDAAHTQKIYLKCKSVLSKST